MIEFRSILAIVMVSFGAFFLLIGSIGLIRLPDFYSRTHAVSKSDTLGMMLVLGGLALYLGFNLNALKLMIAVVFVALTNPTGSHALAKAALLSGIKPWFKGDERKNQAGGE